jgi:hypothetical protein
MTQYTMLKPDKSVYVDGQGVHKIDYTGTKDFHAIQYNDESSSGHIEYGKVNSILGDETPPNIKITSEDEIEELSGITLDEFISRRNAAIAAETPPPL